MNPYLVIYLLVAHYVSDFMLQTDEMALQKSTSNAWLSRHVAVYTVALLAAVLLYNGAVIWWSGPSAAFHLEDALVFAALNGAIHWITDWCTSRWSARLWKAGRRHDFFCAIGADQLAHGATLVLTANWLLA